MSYAERNALSLTRSMCTSRIARQAARNVTIIFAGRSLFDRLGGVGGERKEGGWRDGGMERTDIKRNE